MNFSKMQVPLDVIAIVSIIAVLFVLSAAALFDAFTMQDHQISPTNRKYLITEELKREGTKKDFSLQTVTYGLELKGVLEIKSTSRSAQNPLDIKADIKPISFFNIVDINEVWYKMPETLHFVFPNALTYPIEKNEFGQPEFAVLELKRNDESLKYMGDTSIIYQDEGEYKFFLLESVETFQQAQNGKVMFEHEFSDVDAPLRTMIAEVVGGIGSLKIGPFTQTIAVENLKIQIFALFFVSAVGLLGYLIFSKKNRKKKGKTQNRIKRN